MRHKKWLNLQGTLLAGCTIFAVHATSKHCQKKYGERAKPFQVNYANIANYAFEKLVLNNEKTLTFVSGLIGDKNIVSEKETLS